MTTQTTQDPVLNRRSLVRQAWCLATGIALTHITYVFSNYYTSSEGAPQYNIGHQVALKVAVLMMRGGGIGSYMFSVYWIIRNHCEHPGREFDYGGRHCMVQVMAALALPITIFTVAMISSSLTNNYY